MDVGERWERFSRRFAAVLLIAYATAAMALLAVEQSVRSQAAEAIVFPVTTMNMFRAPPMKRERERGKVKKLRDERNEDRQ